MKQYHRPLKDYEKILTLDPENVNAYTDRGMARLETDEYSAVISDFGDAIRRMADRDTSRPDVFEYRGDARVKLDEYVEAIADYNEAIKLNFGQMTILLSVKQIRGLYPEYALVSDDVLCQRIHDLFWPNMDYASLVKQLVTNGRWRITTLNELYEKRGDAYLKAGDFRRGVLDFDRIFKGIPNFANSTDRRRSLGREADGEEYFLDARSTEFPDDEPVRLWIKITGKKESQTLAYEINCKLMLMNQTITARYDSSGKVVSSSDVSSGWQRVVPDTIGEQLYNGACTTGR